MSMGAVRISRRLWQITTSLSLPDSSSNTCTVACRFIPLVLVCFCPLTLGPSSGGPLGLDVLCTLDFALMSMTHVYGHNKPVYNDAADALARAGAAFLLCNDLYMSSDIS